MTKPQTQLNKFKGVAKELETDDDPKRFKVQLAKYNPVPEKAG